MTVDKWPPENEVEEEQPTRGMQAAGFERILTLIENFFGNRIDATAMKPANKDRLKHGLRIIEEVFVEEGIEEGSQYLNRIIGAVIPNFDK